MNSRALLTATGLGLLSALAIAVFIAVVPHHDGSDAAALTPAAEDGRPRYIVFVGPDTRALLAAHPEFSDALSLTEAASPTEAAALAADEDADGIVIDAETALQFPEPALPALYASGRVIVVFGVDRSVFQRLVANPSAYPGLSRPTSIAAPLAGRTPLVVTTYIWRPGGEGRGGGTNSQEFTPRVFSAVLTNAARGARSQ